MSTKKILVTTALVAPLLLNGCVTKENANMPQKSAMADGQQATSSQVMSESVKANAFFEKAFNERLARSPERQTFQGLKTDSDKWDDISESHRNETIELIKAHVATLKQTINYNELDADAKLSYRLFMLKSEREIANQKYWYYEYPLSQMGGMQSYIPSFLINFHRVDSKDDLQAYIERLKGIKPLFDQLVVNLKYQAEKGIITPQFVFPYVRSDSLNLLKGAPFDDTKQDSTLYADFKAKMEKLSLSDDEKKAYISKVESALNNEVKSAYQGLLTYWSELEKQANTDDGVWKFPDGDTYYKHKLRNTTTTELTAEQIHQTGLDEVARIHDEMKSIMKTVKFKGSLQDFFKFMREDKQFYNENSEAGRQAYLTKAEDVINTMKGRLDELFITKPKADLIVKAVEAFREKSAGKAFYNRPAPDGSRPGIYYANLYNMNDMPTYELEALAYHEGIPGHHMQLAISIELENVPKFRKFGSYTAYIEGWGLYSEFVGKEMGFYQDPYSDFGRLSMELWRACRLVVDTGIHTKRWTREQAIQYLDKNTPAPHMQSVKAIERYIVMPSQATAYKIGMLKIQELRKKAQTELGDKFDIREYHDTVLKGGPIPLNILEEQVDNWIKSKIPTESKVAEK